MGDSKPNEISKHLFVEAWKQVKANAGAAGIDGETHVNCPLYAQLNRPFHLAPIASAMPLASMTAAHRH